MKGTRYVKEQGYSWEKDKGWINTVEASWYTNRIKECHGGAQTQLGRLYPWLSLLPLFSSDRAGGAGKVGVYLYKLQFTIETRALRDPNNTGSARKSKLVQRETQLKC